MVVLKVCSRKAVGAFLKRTNTRVCQVKWPLDAFVAAFRQDYGVLWQKIASVC